MINIGHINKPVNNSLTKKTDSEVSQTDKVGAPDSIDPSINDKDKEKNKQQAKKQQSNQQDLSNKKQAGSIEDVPETDEYHADLTQPLYNEKGKKSGDNKINFKV